MMDIWMVTCMAFVFCALCEFVIVKYLQWRKQQELKVCPILTYKPKVRLSLSYLLQAKEEKEKLIKDYISQVEKRHKDANGTAASIKPMQPSYPAGDFGGYMNMRPMAAWTQLINDKRPNPSWVIIDKVSRFLFPLAFAAFNGAFWPWLLIGASRQNPDAGY